MIYLGPSELLAFEMNLKLFQKHLENVILCPFSSCELIHMDESVIILFPNVHAVEVTDSLAQNVKMKFNDFCSYTSQTYIFENPFSVEVSGAPVEIIT